MERENVVNKNPIIIGGCPRSGTTLLRTLFGAHSHVHAGPELKVIADIVIAAQHSWQKWKSVLVDVHNISGKDFMQDYGRVIVELLFRYAGDKRPCEKTPTNVYVFPLLQIMVPEAKLVHVVRDPRDVVSSLLNMKWTEPDGAAVEYTTDIDAACATWCDAIDAALAAPFRIDVRYEDLCRYPRRTMERLQLFVDLPQEDLVSGRSERVSPLPPGERASHGSRIDQPIDERAIGCYKQRLTEEHTQQVWELCYERALDFGYHD